MVGGVVTMTTTTIFINTLKIKSIVLVLAVIPKLVIKGLGDR